MIAPGNDWLAERASQGEAAAFGELSERCRPLLTAYVRSCVLNWADAEDIVEDTLMDAFRSMPRFDRTRAFEPWLRGICRNRVRGFLRAGRRDRPRWVSLEDSAVAQELEREERGTGGGAAAEVRTALHVCLENLAPGNRVLLELRYAEDLSLAEVAGRCGRSRGSVAQTLWRLRQRLRRALGRPGSSHGALRIGKRSAFVARPRGTTISNVEDRIAKVEGSSKDGPESRVRKDSNSNIPTTSAEAS